MKKRLFSLSALLVAGALLTACGQGQSKPAVTTEQASSSQVSSSSPSSAPSSSSQAAEAKGFVEGNDAIGYVTFSSKVIPFTDLNHDESIANTRQWTNPDNMNILSLTSFEKAAYTDMLKQAGDQAAGMSETDAIVSINLEAFAGVEGVDIAVQQDMFNDIFHESSISRVILPNGAVLASVSFVPTADSDKIYLLSTEGSDEEQVLRWLGEVLPTWTATKPN